MKANPRIHNNNVEVQNFFNAIKSPHSHLKVEGNCVHVKHRSVATDGVSDHNLMNDGSIIVTLVFSDEQEAKDFAADPADTRLYGAE